MNMQKSYVLESGHEVTVGDVYVTKRRAGYLVEGEAVEIEKITISDDPTNVSITAGPYDLTEDQFIHTFGEEPKRYEYDDKPSTLFRSFGDNVVELNPAFAGALIEVFEDFLDNKGVEIENVEKEGNEDAAIIYGSDYAAVVDSLTEVIKQWVKPGAINTEEYGGKST